MINIIIRVINDEPETGYSIGLPGIPNKGDFIDHAESEFEVVRVVYGSNDSVVIVDCKV
jgi:hypothetical protein